MFCDKADSVWFLLDTDVTTLEIKQYKSLFTNACAPGQGGPEVFFNRLLTAVGNERIMETRIHADSPLSLSPSLRLP